MLYAFIKLGCDVIGKQETHSSEQLISVEAGYTGYCGGESGNNDERNRQGRVGLAVKEALGTQTLACPPEFISDCLVKVALDLRGRARRCRL